jgi:hypothetical protein
MIAELSVSVLRFVPVISLLVRLHLREKQSLQLKRDSLELFSVRRLERFVILLLRFLTASMVLLLMLRYSQETMAMNFHLE